MAANKTYQYKLVTLGDTSVGKSSLVIRFVKGEWNEDVQSTIGTTLVTQSVPTQDCTIKFEIWDTAGQERYHGLAPMYYRGAAGAVVVYDITNHESFDKAKMWVNELKRQGSPEMVIALVGNKIDLMDREVFDAEVSAYAEEEKFVDIVTETSAKTGVGVREVFVDIANVFANKIREDPTYGAATAADESGFFLDEDDFRPDPKKSKCCR